MFRVKIILTCLLLISAFIPSPSNANETTKKKPKAKCSAPAYLNPGDKVAIISPAYNSPMEEIEKAAKTIEEWGFKPVIGPNSGKKHAGQYAGTVEERISDLRWALEDPEIKAIICSRGGYGTLQMVDKMTLKDFSSSPKWLVGFSDISTLLNMEACAGVMGIHGAMGLNLARKQDQKEFDTSTSMLRFMLQGIIPNYEIVPHPMNLKGNASGILIGGNLSTIAPLLATQADYFSNNNFILLVEEVDETFHNIDRLFNTLKLSGVLAQCKGVILGDFTNCRADLGYESAESLIRGYIEPYKIPLICGFPAGHGSLNLPLLIGAPTTMNVTDSGATLLFDIPCKSKPTVKIGLPAPTLKPEDNSEDFVNITDVIPDVILEIRYFGTYNFVGRRIDGYKQPTALLTQRAADSLRAVSEDVMRLGYRLKIYDAYRPQMAVDHFVRWAKDIPDTMMRRYFYPDVDKSLLFVQDYIAAKSGHTRGSTVDLTLFDMNTEKELDMGGTFDWFGVESHPDFGGDPNTNQYKPNGKITAEQFHNRMILRAAMLRHGFKPIDSEWWHFTLKDEPYPDTYFTFPVEELKK